MADFEGKIITITGAASGMGLATAKLLASRGATLSLADINKENLSGVALSLAGPDRHMLTVLDVSNSDAVNKWIEATVKRFGRLDGAVNFAGILGEPTKIGDVTDEQWDRTFNVNLKGVFYCIRAEVRAMGPGGRIVSAGSVWGQKGTMFFAEYSASKAGVINLTETAAREYPDLRINCVAPGGVATAMTKDIDTEDIKAILDLTIMKRKGEAVEVANGIVFLLSDQASFVTGACWNIDGGYH